MADGIRSIQRAFLVLRAMNEKPVWSLQELQVCTGLPKSTLHRILSALRDERYVRCDEGMYGYYQLTSNVLALSKGVTERSHLVDVAAPILIATTKRIRWPISMGVIDGHEMRVSFCTMPYSPYAIRPSSFGRRYGLFDSALGKAYFTYCGSVERRILYDHLRAHEDPSVGLPSCQQMKGVIQETRKTGFGVRYGRTSAESSAFAIPVFSRGELLATMCYSTFSGSLDETAIKEFLPVLKDAAQTVGALWDQAQGNSEHQVPKLREH
ncbi:MAG TPA: helix-turn-helix domain-containing protein [Candidimonas sp.]|nr:helix-turn-helix domain-containing protein [Candidimonas sp.]